MIEKELNAIIKKHLKKSIIRKRNIHLYTEEYKYEWGAGWKQSALYFVFDSLERVTYIGWTENYSTRIRTHLSNNNKKFKYDENHLIRIISGDLLFSLIKEIDKLISKYFVDICLYDIESLCILLYKPKRNKCNYKGFPKPFSLKPAPRRSSKDKNAHRKYNFTYGEMFYYLNVGTLYASNKTKFLFQKPVSIFDSINDEYCLPLCVNAFSLT